MGTLHTGNFNRRKITSHFRKKTFSSFPFSLREDFIHKDNRLELSIIILSFTYKFICPFQAFLSFPGLLRAWKIMPVSPDSGRQRTQPSSLILLMSSTAMPTMSSLSSYLFYFPGTTCRRTGCSLLWPHVSRLNNQLNMFILFKLYWENIDKYNCIDLELFSILSAIIHEVGRQIIYNPEQYFRDKKPV